MRATKETLLVLAALVAVLSGGPSLVRAQEQGVDREVEEAKALYREANFAEAIVKLQHAVTQLRRSRDIELKKDRLAEAYLHLALSHFALDDRTAARDDLKAMLRLDRERRLDPQIYAPPILDLLEEARAEVAGEPASDLGAGVRNKKGGSKTPLILLGVGGAAAAGVAVAAGSGGGDARRGGVATVSIEITKPNPPSDGVVGVTQFVFNPRITACGQNPPPCFSGNTVFSWDFGDGTTGSGFGVSHTYQAEGTFTIVLTARDDGGTSGTARTTVAARSLSGTWDWVNSRGGRFVLQMMQRGVEVSGRIEGGEAFTGIVSSGGNTAGFVNLSARCRDFGGVVRLFSGNVNERITAITGTGRLPCDGPELAVTLTRR